MRKLKIGVIDLIAKCPTRNLWARIMNANLANVMPQVIATWCEQDGHDVTLSCYTGLENLPDILPRDVDLVFVGAFSQAGQLAYALSNLFRAQGAVTVLGGPHARCYPQDARKYFDYVLGFTDRSILREVLRDCTPQRPIGRHLSGDAQPTELPGVRERWKYIEQTLKKAPVFKFVPMIGSLGCPYTCSFCIDSTVKHQPLSFDVMKDDLRFLVTKLRRPRVGWQDPNFGVLFDDTLSAIEEAVPPGSIEFGAESSLSLLSEANVKRLARNGFSSILPGIESWYDLGNKSKTGSRQGEAKLLAVAGHVNTIQRHIPYLQANFVLGLDSDEGDEPFELTKRFVDLAPASFPAYSLLSAFGQAAPLNLSYQREGRVLPFPFHFLNNNHAMNVRPRNYTWPELYDHIIDVTHYSFSWERIVQRFQASTSVFPRWLNVARAVCSEGWGRLRFYKEVRRRLDEDRPFRAFFEGETTVLPSFYRERIRRDLGPLWDWLPAGAIEHDPHAYLKEHEARALQPVV